MATEVLADEAALREGRRARARAQMEANGIDALVLGREANARYVAGAPRLWTAGTRPFGPGCVFVGATDAVHLVSTWDEGIPDDIPRENLFGITWNPGNLLAWLQGIEGLRDAKCIGTDSLTPRFARLLPKVFPNAELVDAEPALQAARRVKTREEVVAIRAALAVAEAALAEAVATLRPGVTTRELAAVFMDAMAAHGVTTPATQRVAWKTSAGLVAFDAAVVANGYTGEVGRTWPAQHADPRVYTDADEIWKRLLDACRPGAPCSDLLGVYDTALPVATGLGLGFDTPVVVRDLAATAARERLEPGMVLALSVHGPVFRKDAVLITDDGPEVLTSSPHWHAR